jgi:3D (Asp-Asp-Asp) domain-containing protein
VRLGTVAVSCLFVSTLIAAHGSTKKPILLTPQSPNTAQGLEGGFWRTDNNYDPILHLKNVLLKNALDVTPQIFFADGAEYILPVVHLEAAGVASIDIKLAIQHAPSVLLPHVSDYGMVGIAYRWSWPAVTVSIQNTDEIASLSGVSAPHAETRAVHLQPEVSSAQVIRGTWWLPTNTSDDVIALGNTSLKAKQVQVRISDGSGGLLVEKRATLASHTSQLLHLNELLSGNFEEGDAGDITILYAGPSHAVVASASVEDETTGYSVTPHMVEQNSDPDETAHPVTLHAPGIMLGKPESSMLFPVDTVFTPYAVLHNVSKQLITASLALTSDAAGKLPGTRQLDAIPVPPGASIVVKMGRYFDAINPLPNGYGHLSVSYTGRIGDLLFDTGSADQTGNYVFQVMPSLETPTIHKIICFWSVEGDTSTMISIWNYANSPQDATLLLQYSGGQYRIPVHLGPRHAYNLDVMSLVRSRVPDAAGKLIPAYITSGSATLVGPGGELDHMTVVVSASTYNVRNATCWPICLDCGGIVSVSVNNLSVALQHSAQATGVITTESGSNTDTTGSWSSSNSSIASVDGSGVVSGVALGSTSITFSPSTTAPSAGTTCFYSEPVCPDETFEGSGPVTVVDESPAISSISPTVWNAGTQPTITIAGQHFGTNPPGGSNQGGLGFTDSGINVLSYPQWTDTQIQATINVPSNSPSESVSVTVTSSGYGNNAFNGQQAGQSPTSQGQTISVVPITPKVSLQRTNLMQISATGTPTGGAFSYVPSTSAGTTNASIAFSSGANQYTNPNPTTLTDPANPSSLGLPSPGGLLNVVAQYQTGGGTATDQFNVPTFGMSCYYTTLQSDWGTAPSNCKSVKISGVTYSGTVTNPPNLTGTFCSAFIAEVKLQGSGVLNSGQAVQYISGAYVNVSTIKTADGTTLTANKTLARDRNIISSKGVLMNVDQVGTGLAADDAGQAIVGYRLDLYRGAGVAQCNNFNNIMSVGACNPASSGCPAQALQ